MQPFNNWRQHIHKLNGALLESLSESLPLIAPGWSSSSWVINAIILYRDLKDDDRITFDTSATLHAGEPFWAASHFRPRKGLAVTSIDLPVPLMKSLSGYCVRRNTPVWIGDLDAISHDSSHPLYGLYRQYAYVGVHPKGQPRGEFVYPIRVRLGMADVILGVINCETWTAEDTPFDTDAARIQWLMEEYCNAHAPILAAALPLRSEEEPDACAALVGAGQLVLASLASRIRREYEGAEGRNDEPSSHVG